MHRVRSHLTVSLVAGLLLLSVGHLSLAGGEIPLVVEELGMLEVSVQVDGLSCPFCAYGLEKKLRKVENIADLRIQVDEGRAVVQPKEGTSVDLAALEQAVRDGGFTPRNIGVRARGHITELNGIPALELPGDTVLLLAESAETSALLASVNSKGAGGTVAVVLVEGQAERQQSEGHAGHPYTLTIRSFEVA